MGDEDLGRLHQMIAVAQCNTLSRSNAVTASYAIHAFGVELQDETERRNTVDFLEQVDSSGWSTTASIAWLLRCWYEEPSYNGEI